MKISIAEVKRRLAPGTVYTGEFVGTNAKLAGPGNIVTKRKIVKQTSEMVSEMLEGPKVGHKIHLNWRNVVADERDGSIFLTMTEIEKPEEFLKITI